MDKKYTLLLTILILGVLALALFSHFKSEEPLQVKIVPLDSRPANYYVPKKLAELSGMEPVLPPKEYLGSLNEQGSIDKINAWLTDTTHNSHDPDLVIVSADMLAFGGLVPSRKYQGLSARELNDRLMVLAHIKDSYPHAPVYAYSSIQRLAPTLEQEEDLEAYQQIRRWAILRHRVELEPCEIEDDPRELEQALSNLEEEIPPERLDSYVKSRAQNQQVNKSILQYVKNGYIDRLIIGLDDAHEHGLHLKEQAELEEEIAELELEDRVDIYAGLDELDGVLMATFLSAKTNESLAFYVTYRGSDALTKAWIPTFETRTIKESVHRHIASAGGKITENKAQADVILYVNTPLEIPEYPPGNSDNRLRNDEENAHSNPGASASSWSQAPEPPTTQASPQADHHNQGRSEAEFAAKIAADLEQGHRVAVADVEHVNRANEAFIQQLYQQADTAKLMAFSGWNTAGNAIGQAVAQATGRYHALEGTTLFSQHSAKKAASAQLALLFHRFMKDHHYRNQVMPAAEELAQSTGSEHMDRDEQAARLEAFVAREINQRAEEQLHNYLGKAVEAGGITYQVSGAHEVSVSLPWKRLFEADIQVEFILEESLD